MPSDSIINPVTVLPRIRVASIRKPGTGTPLAVQDRARTMAQSAGIVATARKACRSTPLRGLPLKLSPSATPTLRLRGVVVTSLRMATFATCRESEGNSPCSTGSPR